MCLTVDEHKTQKHSLIKTNKKMMFWKEFELTEKKGILCTPFFSCLVKRSSEYIKPDYKFPSITKRTDLCFQILIEGGCIHAYCKRQLKNADSKYIVIPIIVESNDVIAFGQRSDVCFFKYKISNQTWINIEKTRAKLYRT